MIQRFNDSTIQRFNKLTICFWRHKLLQPPLRQPQSFFLQLLSCLPCLGRERDVWRWRSIVVAQDRVVPAFDVKVGVIAGAEQGVDDFRPVCLAEAGRAVFGYAVMTDAV